VVVRYLSLGRRNEIYERNGFVALLGNVRMQIAHLSGRPNPKSVRTLTAIIVLGEPLFRSSRLDGRMPARSLGWSIAISQVFALCARLLLLVSTATLKRAKWGYNAPRGFWVQGITMCRTPPVGRKV